MPFRLTSARRPTMAAVLVTLVVLAARPLLVAQAPPAAQATGLPSSLTAAEFWALVSAISEPGGYFRITDNYTSNENEIGTIFTMLRERGRSGGVYLGVGPEQNFTYIAALRPQMAFIIDIRRQAVMQHLMFKAMFELSKDRADFISMLFARPRPEGVGATTAIAALWEAFFAVRTDLVLAERVKTQVIDRLTRTHRFSFNEDEKWQLNSVLDAFVMFGPGITTRGSAGRGGGGNSVSFADLTGWSLDQLGRPQSFLSTEEHFQTVRTMHEKHLIVPVSGDFGGPKALQAIGEYLRSRGASVSAFYVSNVEQYLYQDGKQLAFYRNVASMPLAESAVFIRPYAMRRYGPALTLCGIAGYLRAVEAGRASSYNDSLACTQ